MASKKITSENEKFIISDQKCPEIFNNYFGSIVKELKIPIDQILLNDASTFDDLIIAAVHKRHQSILRIKEKIKKYELFCFYQAHPDKMLSTDPKKVYSAR